MMKNMKIRNRMLVSYFIITVILIIVGVVSMVMMQQASGKLQQFYDKQFHTVENALDIRRTVFSARGNMLAAIVQYDDDYIASAKSDFANIKTLLTEIRGTYQGDMSQLDTVERNLQNAEPYLAQIGELCARQEDDEAFELYMRSYKPYMDEVRDIMTDVGETADRNAKAKVEEGAELARIADLVVVLMIVAAVGVSVVFALIMSNSVRKPVEEMREVAAHLAEGKMDLDITHRSSDELGQMADSMREMTKVVKVLIGDID